MNKTKQLPSVVVFGRTNVGKSTLFNRLTEKNQALVSDIEGTTRDSNVGQAEWQGRTFELIDTGGIIETGYLLRSTKKIARKPHEIDIEVQKRAIEYLRQADVILFVVDAKTGPLPQDKEMADNLKKILPRTDKVILVVNKADNLKLRRQSAEFFRFSMGDPAPVSSTTGSGTGDLLDLIVDKLGPKEKDETPLVEDDDEEVLAEDEQDEDIKSSQPISGHNKAENSINICLMGKPNVGKSSLLNAILGYERVIVSPVPHTTREPQDTDLQYKNYSFKLVDTAGISKKGRQSAKRRVKGADMLVKYGIAKSINTLKRSDLVLFIMDINEEITHQDAQIIQELVENNKSIILIANKWDLIEERDTKKFTQYVYGRLPFLTWAPLLFVSAKTKEKVHHVLDLAIKICESRKITIPDSQLNTFLMKIIKVHRPAKAKGTKHPYIYELKQTYFNPPKFKIRIGVKDTIHYSYVRFIENRLRENYGFIGTPIHIRVTKNRPVHGAHDERLNKKKVEMKSAKKHMKK